MKDWELRRDVLEEGRRGVDGREGGLFRVADVESFDAGRAPVAGVDMVVTGSKPTIVGVQIILDFRYKETSQRNITITGRD